MILFIANKLVTVTEQSHYDVIAAKSEETYRLESDDMGVYTFRSTTSSKKQLGIGYKSAGEAIAVAHRLGYTVTQGFITIQPEILNLPQLCTL